MKRAPPARAWRKAKRTRRKATRRLHPRAAAPLFRPYELANWPGGAAPAPPPSLAVFPPPPDLPRPCLLCGTQLLSTAYALIGAPYRSGGTSPETGFDCSGFVRYVYEMNFPVKLPPSAPLQYKTGIPVPREELAPGDLVFFRTRRGWHVGMFVGGDSFIHSPNRRKTVTVSPLFSDAYWRRAFVGARRVPLPEPGALAELSSND